MAVSGEGASSTAMLTAFGREGLKVVGCVDHAVDDSVIIKRRGVYLTVPKGGRLRYVDMTKRLAELCNMSHRTEGKP